MECPKCNEVKKLIQPRLDFLREAPTRCTNSLEFYLLNNINNILNKTHKDILIERKVIENG